MSAATDARADMDALYHRADTAASEEERAECLRDIEVALTAVDEPWQRARLLMCRTRVRSSRWQTREVLQDALAAMSLFEEAGDTGGAVEAASLGAAFASRLGEMSLAAELATSCILSMGFIAEDNVVAEVANRLGIFCYSFLDYDRAIEQFEVSLAAAERCGDAWMICRQLHNIAEALLLAVRQDKASGQGDGRYDRFGATVWKRPSRSCSVWARRLQRRSRASSGCSGSRPSSWSNWVARRRRWRSEGGGRRLRSHRVGRRASGRQADRGALPSCSRTLGRGGGRSQSAPPSWPSEAMTCTTPC